MQEAPRKYQLMNERLFWPSPGLGRNTPGFQVMGELAHLLPAEEGQGRGGQAATPRTVEPLTSRSCAALGRVSGFLSRAVFRKSRNSADLGVREGGTGGGSQLGVG